MIGAAGDDDDPMTGSPSQTTDGGGLNSDQNLIISGGEFNDYLLQLFPEFLDDDRLVNDDARNNYIKTTISPCVLTKAKEIVADDREALIIQAFCYLFINHPDLLAKEEGCETLNKAYSELAHGGGQISLKTIVDAFLSLLSSTSSIPSNSSSSGFAASASASSVAASTSSADDPCVTFLNGLYRAVCQGNVTSAGFTEDQYHDDELVRILKVQLGDRVHVLDPAVVEVVSPFNRDPVCAYRGAHNIAKAVANFVPSGRWDRPIILPLLIGGNHWTLAMLLPKHYCPPYVMRGAHLLLLMFL